MDPGTPVYNLPAAIRGTGRLRPEVLERCLAEIERRHEVLRTRFAVVDGVPVQIPLAFESEPAVPRLPLVDLSGLPGRCGRIESARLATEEARRPFDLSAGRPVRATLLRLGSEEHVLLLTQHHIVCDVWSIGLLVRELAELYRAFAAGRPSPLPEPEVQFADFAEWQREHYQGATLDQLVAWWKERLGDNRLVSSCRPTIRGRRSRRSAARSSGSSWTRRRSRSCAASPRPRTRPSSRLSSRPARRCSPAGPGGTT